MGVAAEREGVALGDEHDLRHLRVEEHGRARDVEQGGGRSPQDDGSVPILADHVVEAQLVVSEQREQLPDGRRAQHVLPSLHERDAGRTRELDLGAALGEGDHVELDLVRHRVGGVVAVPARHVARPAVEIEVLPKPLIVVCTGHGHSCGACCHRGARFLRWSVRRKCLTLQAILTGYDNKKSDFCQYETAKALKLAFLSEVVFGLLKNQIGLFMIPVFYQKHLI